MSSKEDEQDLPPIEVPKDALSGEALLGVIENFILREGTDYGAEEVSFETKSKQIIRKIDSGEVRIVYDPNSETVSLVTELQWKKLSSRSN